MKRGRAAFASRRPSLIQPIERSVAAGPAHGPCRTRTRRPRAGAGHRDGPGMVRPYFVIPYFRSAAATLSSGIASLFPHRLSTVVAMKIEL